MLFKLTTRRAFLAASALAAVGMTGCASTTTKQTASSAPTSAGATATAISTPGNRPLPTSKQALQKLLDGNFRFEHGETVAQRQAIAQKQTPFAIVFSCADSRVPPEIVFNQSLGDLFTIRTAGHVIDNATLGSIEYGVADLSIPLLVVLGHERCGAVKATIEAIDHHTAVPGSIQALVDYVRPSVLKAQGQGNVRLASAIRNNVIYTVNALSSRSKIISDAVNAGKLTIVGADYDLDAGTVRMITG
jgi:carbonic anhydrase